MQGKEFTVRKCHPNAREKIGTCEEAHILEMKTSLCYCDTDGCNGTNQILSNTVLMTILIGILMIMAKIQH